MIRCKFGFPEDRRHRRDRDSTKTGAYHSWLLVNKVVNHKSIIMVTIYKLVDYVAALMYLI